MSAITYNGKPGVVKIGERWIEPGDTVSDKPSKTAAFCDAASLARLASRGDFDGAAPTKKTTKKEKVSEDG